MKQNKSLRNRRFRFVIGLLLLAGGTACGKQSGFFYTEMMADGTAVLYRSGEKLLLNEGWPVKQILGRSRPRRMLAVTMRPDGRRVWAATKFDIYTWSLSSKKWQAVPRTGLHTYASLSALQWTPQGLYAGTTSYGVYRFKNNRWQKLAAGLPGEDLPRKRLFYETVTALSAAPDGTVYAGLHFFGGVYRLRPGRIRWEQVALPAVPRVHGLFALPEGIWVFDGSRWIAAGGLPQRTPPEFLSRSRTVTGGGKKNAAVAGSFGTLSLTADEIPSKSRHAAAVGNRRGIYLTCWNARPDRLQALVKTMKARNLDTLVIDIKDDDGLVCYAGSNAQVQSVGSYRNRIPLDKLIPFAKKHKLWLVGRVVVFKDPWLHARASGRYALKDRYTGGNWNSTTRERWVDPFNSFVHQYNLAVAKEALQLGFNEIQFDYIRFPTDGPIYRIKYPSMPAGAWKLDALENFLAAARRDLLGPFSVDIYGFNAWFSMGSWMGQDIVLFAQYADAISPMHYPSHFDWNFRAEKGRTARAYEILKHGTLRPLRLTGGAVEIRPWAQAFRWRAYGYGAGYINRQLKGVRDGGGTGWLLWNAANSYPLLPLVKHE